MQQQNNANLTSDENLSDYRLIDLVHLIDHFKVCGSSNKVWRIFLSPKDKTILSGKHMWMGYNF